MKREQNLFSKPRLKSRLPGPVRRLLGFSLVLAAFMLANTIYLLLNRLADVLDFEYFAIGETSLPKLFQVMLLTHTGIGLLLSVLLLVFLMLHLPKVWQRRDAASLMSGIFFALVGVTLAITGLFILTAAASRNNAWAWWAHVLSGVAVVAGYALHRLTSYTRPLPGPRRNFLRATAVLVLLLVIGHGFTKRDILLTDEALQARSAGLSDGPGGKYRDVAKFIIPPLQKNGFVPAGFVPPGSPFFPSAATTSSGGYLPARIITRGEGADREKLRNEIEKYGFVKDTLIGAESCKRCHPDIVEQWSKSAHRFSSFNNPFYEATVNFLREKSVEPNAWIKAHIASFPEAAGQVGRVKSKWCAACHDPALMLPGDMIKDIDRTTAEAQAGLTCLACHAIDKIHNQTGNGNYNIADEQEDPYIFPNAKTGTVGAFFHDAALKARPAVHKRQMMKPFFRSSEFCATCHKVSLTEPVNNYRWLRGQNEYDNWHDSGIARNAARTFYLPPVKRECQSCHMPLEPAPLGDVAAKNGFVRSHRFIAVNSALPFLRQDEETIQRIENFLQNEKLRVDLFALRTASNPNPIMALDKTRPVLPAGERITIDVVVRNKGVGHTFPGGTNDSNEGWFEFTVSDPEGRQFLISGALDANGHLDPMAHTFKAVILDRHGHPINKRNAQDIYVTVYANVIAPGTADIAHYEFDLPSWWRGESIRLRARLRWRKFDRTYTEFAYRANPEGFRRYAAVPELPIIDIAADSIDLRIGDRLQIPDSMTYDADQWERFNDYGIGLLLEGDTRAAALAFEQVLRLQPSNIEGPLNLAKTAIQDGQLDRAYAYLQQCEQINKGDARVAWAWGLTLQEDGRYPQAIAAYRRVLEEFPEDRAAWRNLGRTYFLDQKFGQAIQAFEKVLSIDPEDRVAWYHLMLCHKALGNETAARTAEAAYAYYQIDESAQALTRAYKLENPGVNLMAQRIRTHKLFPAQQTATDNHHSSGTR